MNISRREFVLWTALGGLSSLAPRWSGAQNTKHVVVVGGGFGGATVAKYLRLWSNGGVRVTLVDPDSGHVSCVLSNLMLTGQMKLSDLTFTLDSLTDRYGVEALRDRVEGIDTGDRRVTLASGKKLAFDRLVLSPGIAFMDVPGLDSSVVPHAWIAGENTIQLRDQLDTLSEGSTVIVTVPPAPYRCPPGPYERACLLAGEVQRAGGGRVIVLDANEDIQAEREMFTRAFSELYGDTLEYRSTVTVEAVDSNAGVVVTNEGEYRGDVVNVIPTQQAADLVRKSGLTDGRWAPVDPVTYQSKLEGAEGIYILGDSQGTSQPKSAHMASSQAKVCADAILRESQGLPTHQEERLANITTNSACYSTVTRSEASWLTANYALDTESGDMRLVHMGTAETWDRDHHKDMFDWAENLFADTFG